MDDPKILSMVLEPRFHVDQVGKRKDEEEPNSIRKREPKP
jgi:hypothetical protein